MAFSKDQYYRFTFRNKNFPGRTFHGAGWSDENEFVARAAFASIINSNPDNEPFNPSIDLVVKSTPEEAEQIKRENDAAVVAAGGETVEELTSGKPNSLVSPPLVTGE